MKPTRTRRALVFNRDQHPALILPAGSQVTISSPSEGVAELRPVELGWRSLSLTVSFGCLDSLVDDRNVDPSVRVFDHRWFNRQLGLVLKESRLRHGLTLDQTCLLLGKGWTIGTVSSYERGARQLTVQRLKILADLYGIDSAVTVATALERCRERAEQPLPLESGVRSAPVPSEPRKDRATSGVEWCRSSS